MQLRFILKRISRYQYKLYIEGVGILSKRGWSLMDRRLINIKSQHYISDSAVVSYNPSVAHRGFSTWFVFMLCTQCDLLLSWEVR